MTIAHTVGVIAAADTTPQLTKEQYCDQAPLLWTTTLALPNNTVAGYQQYNVDVDFSGHAGKTVAIAAAAQDDEYQLATTSGQRGFRGGFNELSLPSPFDREPSPAGDFASTRAIYGEFEDASTTYSVGIRPGVDGVGVNFNEARYFYFGTDATPRVLELPPDVSLKRVFVYLGGDNAARAANMEVGIYGMEVTLI